MNQQTPNMDDHIARVYLREVREDQIVVELPNTRYRLHLRPTGEVKPTAQGRVRGVIRCRVWKMDRVSAGGSYIEPVFGRPRRVQGPVVATLPETNSVVIDIMDTPIVGDLPERHSVADLAVGTRIGLDVYSGAAFEPAAVLVGSAGGAGTGTGAA